MDPEATWHELIEAIIAKDQTQSKHWAEILVNWLRNGGFAHCVSLYELPADWQRNLCLRICNSILTAPENYWRVSDEQPT